ncbi:lytic transglycosylase domain-containing protein [Novosphingobium sp.]|jgi:soluble lytic murein transglycosylase-like protein|uniref:lytic transglycosylase domain-containing protein n=1 Tax=Novosphingobium sp. TaxID=1874826 RepID=UPI003BA9C41F
MTRLSGCVLPSALALASTSTAWAAEAPRAMQAQTANPAAGVTTQTGQGGFALVTFGAWPNQELNPRRSPSLPVTVRPLRAVAGGDRPGSFRRAIYLPHVAAAERQYALPPGLLDALIWTESRYNPLALSRAGAAGLGQLMPGTAQALGIGNRYDPLTNITGAARYLRTLLDRFGMVHLAIAAYNAGPGTVERAWRVPLNGETPGYVRDVLRNWRSE